MLTVDYYKSVFLRLIKDESAATAIEYGLITGIISIAIIGLLHSIGASILGTFTTVYDKLQ